MQNAIVEAFSQGVFAITLFVNDTNESKCFYGTQLGLQMVFSDPNSAVYQVGSTFINLLIAEQAPALIQPAPLGNPSDGVTSVYTIKHNDVDLVARQPEAAGVALLNGPLDRPWGVRTLSFQDPSGHVFEVANHS